ncbi:MAG TPA: hypothetical protein PLW93_02660 [Candidatus Absconditabacterales bacterium]|nr:hypothetical protein [Candidatus Absconditabacterales bacterium]
MLAIFKPINNGYGFDLREFEVKENGKPGPFRWISIEDHIGILGELPVLKPLVRCSDKYEFYNQFQQFIN